ncbi:NAD-dependent epimerase/dehydratase family protein [Salinispora arenicola]|uniref:NAD-dependent epimerase/dehydratase family protein n=1 Tax=Salinispora arenicola TaxID=168697 RepID=UPI0027DD8678|nr:NAD-dependent epimerase/dehydratase family protein [Salinispora arenicola]
MKVLVAGGAGFIGSTVASALIDAGHRPIVLDSLVTGRREFCHGRDFYHGDIADGRGWSTRSSPSTRTSVRPSTVLP